MLSCLLALLTGCTLATDAGDRKFVPSLDLNYTFRDMSATHPGKVMDVALVVVRTGGENQVQGRALIALPPPVMGTAPDQRLVLERAMQEPDMELEFFVDDNAENGQFDAPEHHWLRKVAANGEGSFSHTSTFDPLQPVLAAPDIVFAGPADDAQRTCLTGLIPGFQTLEIKVYNEAFAWRQVGYVKVDSQSGLRARPLPLHDVIDAGSKYRFEVFVNGVQAKEPFEKLTDAQTQQLTISLGEWFPATSAQISACGATP